MDAQTDSELDTFGLLESLIQVSHRIQDTQARAYSSLCVIFMGLGIAEIDEQTVTEKLGDMPIVALNNFSTHLLIGTHHVTPVFRVEVAGESCRVYQITKHNRELSSFRVRRRCRRERFNLSG